MAVPYHNLTHDRFPQQVITDSLRTTLDVVGTLDKVGDTCFRTNILNRQKSNNAYVISSAALLSLVLVCRAVGAGRGRVERGAGGQVERLARPGLGRIKQTEASIRHTTRQWKQKPHQLSQWCGKFV